MKAMTRPYLLIDIDGVLNPLNRGTKPAGFERHELASLRRVAQPTAWRLAEGVGDLV